MQEMHLWEDMLWWPKHVCAELLHVVMIDPRTAVRESGVTLVAESLQSLSCSVQLSVNCHLSLPPQSLLVLHVASHFVTSPERHSLRPYCCVPLDFSTGADSRSKRHLFVR